MGHNGRTEPLRVVAGQYRSRPLRSLPGMDIRPTADRLRETLFNVLTAGNPAALEGSTWLDLYAGTGAVGIEALSRGASKICFVESSPAAVRVIRENLFSLQVTSGFEVIQTDTLKALRKLESESFRADFVFLDPPYKMDKAYTDTLARLAKCSLVGPPTLVIAEHPKKFDPGEGFGFLKRSRQIVRGDAALSFYQIVQPSERPT
jgi:16S rRNA (guanine966-N2)-methyltransferase